MQQIVRLTENELIDLVKTIAHKRPTSLREGISYQEAEACKAEFLRMVEDGELDAKETLLQLVRGYVGGDVIDSFLKDNVLRDYYNSK